MTALTFTETLCDDVPRRHVEHHRPERDADHAVDRPAHEDQARPWPSDQPAEAEDDRLPVLGSTRSTEDQPDDEHDEQRRASKLGRNGTFTSWPASRPNP
jgi:hypothetical protein